MMAVTFFYMLVLAYAPVLRLPGRRCAGRRLNPTCAGVAEFL